MRLTSVATGTETTEPVSEIDAWKDKTYKALDYPKDSCEEEPQLKIRAATIAAGAWTILKENYEGKRRTHISHLFYSVTGIKFDDRNTTIKAHIEAFERAWLQLAQAVATATASSTTADGAIVHFTKSDTWKAYILLNSFPRIQPYHNIIDNIANKEDTVSYANVVIRLREISDRDRLTNKRGTNASTAENIEPAAALLQEAIGRNDSVDTVKIRDGQLHHIARSTAAINSEMSTGANKPIQLPQLRQKRPHGQG